MSKIIYMGIDEIRKAIDDGLVLVIPVGSIEYHGSHLPVGTDLLIPEGIMNEVEKRVPIVIAPSIVYSPNGHSVSGAEGGTVDITVECFMKQVGELAKEYRDMGFQRIIFVVHHDESGITPMIQVEVDKICSYELKKELGKGWWTENKEPRPCRFEICTAVFEMYDYFGGHAGDGESGAILALYPELVHLEKLSDNEPWWNATVTKLSKERAQEGMKIVIDKWVDKIKGIYENKK